MGAMLCISSNPIWVCPEIDKTEFRENNFATNQMGVSENSVPLNPMVNDHYPY